MSSDAEFKSGEDTQLPGAWEWDQQETQPQEIVVHRPWMKCKEAYDIIRAKNADKKNVRRKCILLKNMKQDKCVFNEKNYFLRKAVLVCFNFQRSTLLNKRHDITVCLGTHERTFPASRQNV